jgi:hypothetical protein
MPNGRGPECCLGGRVRVHEVAAGVQHEHAMVERIEQRARERG